MAVKQLAAMALAIALMGSPTPSTACFLEQLDAALCAEFGCSYDWPDPTPPLVGAEPNTEPRELVVCHWEGKTIIICVAGSAA